MKKQSTEAFCPGCGRNISDIAEKQIETVSARKKRSVILAVIIPIVAVLLIAATVISGIFVVPAIMYHEEDKMVKEALQVVTEDWEELYEDMYLRDMDFDNIIIIKNTRIIKIKPNDSEIFKDVEYVVEFIILSDYYGSAPYYRNIHSHSFVMFYEDGSVEMQEADPFSIHTGMVYDVQFKDIVDEVVDLADRYNRTIEIE